MTAPADMSPDEFLATKARYKQAKWGLIGAGVILVLIGLALADSRFYRTLAAFLIVAGGACATVSQRLIPKLQQRFEGQYSEAVHARRKERLAKKKRDRVRTAKSRLRKRTARVT